MLGALTNDGRIRAASPHRDSVGLLRDWNYLATSLFASRLDSVRKSMAKNKVPKKVFGASVPKTLRRSSIMQNLLGSPLGRQILADVLVAAAGAAALALTRTNAAGKAGKELQAGGARTKEALQDAASAASGVIANAAKEMMLGDSKSTRSRKH